MPTNLKPSFQAATSARSGSDPPGRSLSEYMDWSADMARRMNEVDLVVEGDTDEEKAASFVRAMIEAGLAVKL